MLRSSNSLFLLSPWGTQPATTRAFSFFLPSRRVEDMAASLGPFTVHVFISHRSAESLLSSGSSLASIKYKKSASVCLAEPVVALYHIDAPKGKPPSCKMNSMAHGLHSTMPNAMQWTALHSWQWGCISEQQTHCWSMWIQTMQLL